MPKHPDIKDDLYSFIRVCWPEPEITNRQEALNILCKILCDETVALAECQNNKIVISIPKEKSVCISLGSNTNNQSNAFLSSEDKGANTPKIREILYNKLTSGGGDFNKIIAISKYFSEDLEFRVPSESSTFIAYIKANILNKPEDWNELLDFVTLKTSTDQTEFPYLKMAFIFALLCFPKDVNDENHYSRADFFEAICPYFPRIEKKATIVRDITDGSNDHGKINESNIGRDDLLEEIAEQLRIGNHVVLYGLGGIGKTFICRNILWNYREKYTDGIEYVAWVKYESNLESSLYNKFVRNNIYKPEDYGKKDEILLKFDYEPIIKEMYSQLNDYTNKARNGPNRILREAFNKLGKRFLMIIDNANSITSEEINWLNHCAFRIILTTRSMIDGFHSIHVKGPNTDYCCELYKIKAGKSGSILSDAENSCIRKIIELTGHHTLTIELIAKTQLNSGISEKEMLDRLKQSGFSLNGISDTIDNNGESKILIEHLSKVFDISDIENDESKIRIMRYFSLLEPNTAIGANTIKNWFGLENLNDVNALIKLGWLSRSESNYITIHPVISDVVRHKYPPDYVYSEPFIQGIIKHGIDDIHLFQENVKHCISVTKSFHSIKEDSYGGLLSITALNLQISGQSNKAIEFYDAILEMYKDEPIKTDEDKASLAFIEALRYDCLRKPTEAIEGYKSTLNLGDKLLKDNPLIEAKLYNWIAHDHVSLSDFKSALANFNQELKVYKEANEENSIQAGYCHLNIAILLLFLNESDESKKHMDIGIKILENDASGIAQNYINFTKSLSYCIQEDYKNAQAYLDSAIASDSFFSLFPVFSSMLAPLIADIYEKNGEFNKVIEVVEKSLKSYEDESPPPPFQIINSYLKLAEIYYQQENYELFIENYNQAVSIWQKNVDHFNLTDSFVRRAIISIVDLAQEIAKSYIDAQDYINALNWYNSVESILYVYFAEIDPETTIVLYKIIADLSYHTGNIKNFIICLNKIIDIGEKYSLQDNDGVLNSKKIIDNLIQGTLPSSSESPLT